MPRKTVAPLTLSEEAAINHYLSGHTKTEAYSLAGYWQGQALKTARNQASLFFQRPKIANEVSRRRAKAAEKALVDRAYVITGIRRLYEHHAEYVEIYGEPNKSGKRDVVDCRPRNAVEARKNLEILARDVGVGVPVQKHEIGGPGDFSRLTSEEIAERIAERCRAAGLDPRAIDALIGARPSGTA